MTHALSATTVIFRYKDATVTGTDMTAAEYAENWSHDLRMWLIANCGFYARSNSIVCAGEEGMQRAEELIGGWFYDTQECRAYALRVDGVATDVSKVNARYNTYFNICTWFICPEKWGDPWREMGRVLMPHGAFGIRLRPYTADMFTGLRKGDSMQSFFTS